jgi:hypothetical protein
MKLDVDPFPVHMIDLEEKKILVRSDQASTTKGEYVIVSDELRNRMIVPHNPKASVWKKNTCRVYARCVKPTSSMLIDKYARQQ